MGKQLSPETETALRKLAREIGRARGLDNDALEELFGHLEDKTLGYLSGEDGITEADAVLLTREHFGDPGAFPEADEQVQAPFRSSVSLPRRLAAVAVLTLAVGAAASIARLIAALSMDTGSAIYYLGPRGWSLIWIVMALQAACILFVLNRWKARERRSQQLWYAYRAPTFLAMVLLGMTIIVWCIPEVRLEHSIFSAQHEALIFSMVRMPNPILRMFVVIAPVVSVLFPVLWIWWGDCESVRVRSIVAAAVAWVGTSITVSIPSMLYGSPVFVVGDSTSRIEILPAMDAGAVHQAFGLTPEDVAGTALAMIVLRTVYAVALAVTGAVVYSLISLASRTVRHYGRIRWRPVAR